MLLTKSQQFKFWSLWKQVCQRQGWTAAAGYGPDQVTTERRNILAQCGFDSLTKVDPAKGFERVLQSLLALSDPANLTAQVRLSDMPRIRLKHAITALAPAAYTAAICRDRFGTTDLDDLDEHQLTQLRITLAARRRRAVKSPRQQPPPEPVAANENDPF